MRKKYLYALRYWIGGTLLFGGTFYNKELTNWLITLSDRLGLPDFLIPVAFSAIVSLWYYPKIRDWKEAHILDKYIFVLMLLMTLLGIVAQAYTVFG